MDVLARHLAPLARRLRNLVSRATVNLIDDSKQMQTLQVTATADETLDDCEHWQGYGLTVHPRQGGEALMLSGAGTRAMPLVIAVADRRYRLTGLEEGEVALHDDQGQSVILRRGGIEITGNVKITGDLTLEGALDQTGNQTIAGDVTLTGALDQTGDQTISGTLTIAGIGFAMHKHPGVASGGAQTGGPL